MKSRLRLYAPKVHCTVADNESVVRELGDVTFKKIALELTAKLLLQQAERLAEDWSSTTGEI